MNVFSIKSASLLTVRQNSTLKTRYYVKPDKALKFIRVGQSQFELLGILAKRTDSFYGKTNNKGITRNWCCAYF